MTSSPWPRGLVEPGHDLLDSVQASVGDGDNKVVCLFVRQCQSSAVNAVEGNDSCERKPFVAVDQAVMAR